MLDEVQTSLKLLWFPRVDPIHSSWLKSFDFEPFVHQKPNYSIILNNASMESCFLVEKYLYLSRFSSFPENINQCSILLNGICIGNGSDYPSVPRFHPGLTDIPAPLAVQGRTLNPHPVVRGPHGPRSDENRHFTWMESDWQKFFGIILTKTDVSKMTISFKKILAESARTPQNQISNSFWKKRMRVNMYYFLKLCPECSTTWLSDALQPRKNVNTLLTVLATWPKNTGLHNYIQKACTSSGTSSMQILLLSVHICIYFAWELQLDTQCVHLNLEFQEKKPW